MICLIFHAEFDQDALKRAARAILDADALLIGAGMGVDSGLPDFRGDQGFWKAYPPFAKQRLSFSGMANPRWFYRDPSVAWGFYGHRMNLYRDTLPHEGFSILKRWGAIPSVRWTCENSVRDLGATLIRINPREPQVPRGSISFAAGALPVLKAIDSVLLSL